MLGPLEVVHDFLTLDTALLYVVHRDGVTTISSRAGVDQGQASDSRVLMFLPG